MTDASGGVVGSIPKKFSIAASFHSGWLVRFVGSALLSLILYMVLVGWVMAVILTGLIALHEFGHWFYMKAKGLEPKYPLFIPFFGAFVVPTIPAKDAVTAAWASLAGPLMGGAGALAFFLIGWFCHVPALVVGGSFGFIFNLMQLLPARPFDGGAIVAALSRWVLIVGTAGFVGMAILSHSPFLMLIAVVSGLGIFINPHKSKLLHSGKASNVAELERELNEARLTGGNADPITGAAAPNLVPVPTTRQRIAIGVSYAALAMALAGMTVFSVADIGLHLKKYASVACEVLTAMLRLKNDADWHIGRGYCLVSEEKYADAQTDAEAAIKLNPSSANAYNLLAVSRLMSDQRDATTTAALRTAFQLNDRASLEAFNAVFSMLLVGDYDGALAHANQLPLARANNVKAVALERQGRLIEARRCYNLSVAQSKPEQWGSRLRRALFYVSNGELESARQDLKQLDTVNFYGRPKIAVVAGWYALRSGNIDNAQKQADFALNGAGLQVDALDRATLFASAHRLLSEIYSQKANQAADPQAAAALQTKAQEERAAYKRQHGFGAILIPRDLAEEPRT